VGLWDQIQEALSAVWADLQSPTIDARTRLVISLTEAWQAEQRVSTQIRQTLPEILYEHFRQRLEGMAREDEQHAQLLQERLRGFGVVMTDGMQTHGGSANSLPSDPWRRLRYILAEKRELYERYRQEAGATDDSGLQALLGRLRDDEERHQELLIGMLMQLDAHIHDTIT
jgi:rubrerythrin